MGNLITCLEEWLRDKLPECIFENSEKVFKNHEADLSQKTPEPNMLLLISDSKRKSLCIETNIF